MTAFTLARWFQPEEEINGVTHDELREEILSEVQNATAIAVKGSTVLARTPRGVCAMEAKEVRGCKVVTFDMVWNDRWTRQSFWMNASSVADLGAALRTKPRVAFNTVFVRG